MESKKYPNKTLQSRLRDRDVECRLMWEIKGPKDTDVSWLSCYLVGRNTVIHVSTYKSGGWDAYLPAAFGVEVDDTVNSVLKHLTKRNGPIATMD